MGCLGCLSHLKLSALLEWDAIVLPFGMLIPGPETTGQFCFKDSSSLSMLRCLSYRDIKLGFYLKMQTGRRSSTPHIAFPDLKRLKQQLMLPSQELAALSQREQVYCARAINPVALQCIVIWIAEVTRGCIVRSHALKKISVYLFAHV